MSTAKEKAALTNGAAAAAILAAGIGWMVFGVLALAADAWPAMSNAMNFYRPSGDLSGVSTSAIMVWVVAWVVLARRWGKRQVAMARVSGGSLTMVGIGLLLTFPPFMDLLQGK